MRNYRNKGSQAKQNNEFSHKTKSGPFSSSSQAIDNIQHHILELFCRHQNLHQVKEVNCRLTTSGGPQTCWNQVDDAHSQNVTLTTKQSRATWADQAPESLSPILPLTALPQKPLGSCGLFFKNHVFYWGSAKHWTRLSDWQFSHSVMSDSLWPHGLQHARPPCPSPTYPNSCPLRQWCHPTISSSCHPLLLLPSIFPIIRVFSHESALRIRWPKYWSFSFTSSPSNEYSGLISFRMDWLDLLVVQGTLKSLLQLTDC